MRILLSATLLALLLVPTHAGAGELAGVSMPDAVTVADHSLALNGMGLRKKFFVKVYVAGLYLPQRMTDGAAVLAADTPRQMVMDFLYDVGKDKLCEGWYEGLAANTPDASAALKKDFDTLCGLMEDVVKGQAYTFTYLPGEGTSVVLEGEQKGTVAGKEFADSLLAAWIGAKPGPGEDFKKALLGG
jgi:hypothetical protein